jgi:hypothetical protein
MYRTVIKNVYKNPITIEEEYNKLLKDGVEESEARLVANSVEMNTSGRDVTLGILYSEFDLRDMFIDLFDDDTVLSELLYEIGVDTKYYKWLVRRGQHRLMNGKIANGYYVSGQERLDKGWTEKMVGGRYLASFDARLRAKGDWEMIKDIQKMQRGG